MAAIDHGRGRSSTSDQQIVSVSVDEPGHPLACALVDFFTAHSQGGRLPRRREIPCRALKAALPYLYLMEPVDAALSDWRYRVVGSEVMERLGLSNLHGRLITETNDAQIALYRLEIYRDAIKHGKPRISQGRILGVERDFYEIEVVHLPIDAGNGAIWILGGMFFFN